MLPAQKLKYQVIKENFFLNEQIFIANTRQKLQEYEHKKAKHIKNDMGYSYDFSYERALSEFYDVLYNKFFEKTNEDLFLSIWKDKDTKSLHYNKEFYRLMGAYDMKNSNNKIYGTYFIMHKFTYNKKYNKTYNIVQAVKNYYFLTLEEIKNRFNQLTNEEYLEQINEIK